MLDNSAQNSNPIVAHADVQITQPIGSVTLAAKITVISFVVLAVCAEFITMFLGILPGVILYSILLVVLVNLSYFSKLSSARRMYLAFTLLPLMRILSLAMPVQLVTLIYRYVMVGLPIVFATILVIRFNGLSSSRLNLTLMEWVSDLMVGISGIPLGMIASFVLPAPLEIMADHSWITILKQVIVLTFFGAVVEEVIFRGLIQEALSYPFRSLGFIVTGILYTSMFFGTHSLNYIVFYGVIGLFFGLWVQITESLWGVIIAHSLMNIVLLLSFYLR